MTSISFSINGAAAACGVSRSTLYALIKDGKLTPRKFGGRTLILADELEAYIRSLPTNGKGGRDE